LLLRHPEDFSIVAGSRAAAFLQGFRYDASVLCAFLGVPLVLLLLPFSWARDRRWQQAWSWIGFAMFDVFYFGDVRRHAGLETAALGETLKAVTSSAFTAYLLPLIAFLAAVAALAWGWRKLLARELPPV